MANDSHSDLRPRTAVLTRGFDPSLSFGSARPAVFAVRLTFSPSPEAAEHAFAITTGKIKPAERRARRPDLLADSRIRTRRSWKTRSCRSKPARSEAAVFNSGMAAIMTAFFAFARPNSTIVYTTPLYGGTTGLIHTFLEPFGVRGIAVPSGDCGGDRRGDPLGEELLHRVSGDAGQSDADHDRHRARRRHRAAASRPAGDHGGQHVSRADLPASAAARRGHLPVLGDQVSFGLQRHGGGRGDHQRSAR